MQPFFQSVLKVVWNLLIILQDERGEPGHFSPLRDLSAVRAPPVINVLIRAAYNFTKMNKNKQQ